MFLQSCRRRRCHLNDVERWNEIENIFILRFYFHFLRPRIFAEFFLSLTIIFKDCCGEEKSFWQGRFREMTNTAAALLPPSLYGYLIKSLHIRG